MSKQNTYQNAFYAALRNRFKTLFNRYKVNTLADGGTVRDDSVTKAYMKMAQDNRMSYSIKFAWLGDAGIKQSNGRISKAYTLATTNNATQSNTNNQPYLSGNIAPNERYCLNNPNGGSNYMEHPIISFGSEDAWSVSTILNDNSTGNAASYYLGTATGNNSSILTKSSAGLQFRIFNNSGSVNWATGHINQKYFGKDTCITWVSLGNNTLILYVNGVEVARNTSFSTEMVFINVGYPSTLSVNGNIHAHIIRSQALTQQQVTAEYNLLRSYYPEIPNVTIGTQQWATSNFEAVCTPQGNTIPEMQANGNVEKIPNGGFDTDTNWTKGTGWTISSGMANANVGSLVAISQSIPATIGKLYKTQFTISNYTSGSVVLSSGGIDTTPKNANGTYTEYIKSTTTGSLAYLRSHTSGFVGSIDNVSVQEIGWAGSQELYDGIYAQTAGTVEQKTYAAVKAAAMWCHYNNDVAIGAVYGKLYNWFAVKLFQMDIDYYNAANPATLWGWKVPTRTEFQTLSDFLGGDAVSGGHLKEIGFAHWSSPNTGADNSSGFSALGSGSRNVDGTYANFKNWFRSWGIDKYVSSITNIDSTFAFFDQQSVVIRGYPIRLIKA